MTPTKVSRTVARQRLTRQRLLEAAYELMSTQGVDATTVQQITETADIGFGTFYNYYDSKEALALDVLDCMIHNIGSRNDLLTAQLRETDPVVIVANSVRFVVHEIVTNPVYRWWTERLDLLIERMRVGFRPFGIRDIALAVEAGRYHIIDDDHDLAWSQLIWIMVGGSHDILRARRPVDSVDAVVEGVLRVMGVDHAAAHDAVRRPLPNPPKLPIDFSVERRAPSSAAAAVPELS